MDCISIHSTNMLNVLNIFMYSNSPIEPYAINFVLKCSCFETKNAIFTAAPVAQNFTRILFGHCRIINVIRSLLIHFCNVVLHLIFRQKIFCSRNWLITTGNNNARTQYAYQAILEWRSNAYQNVQGGRILAENNIRREYQKTDEDQPPKSVRNRIRDTRDIRIIDDFNSEESDIIPVVMLRVFKVTMFTRAVRFNFESQFKFTRL